MNELMEQNRVSPKRTRERVRQLTAEDLLTPDAPLSGSGWQLPFQELWIEGLLSFGEKAHFEFGQLNILVGPNGSGKSNLIDCIRIFRSAPLDIQEAFKDTGFEEGIYKGDNNRRGTALLEVTAKLPESPDKIRHQVRLGPSFKERARLEEAISGTKGEKAHSEQYFPQRSHLELFRHRQTS